jgi:hypothetical protein
VPSLIGSFGETVRYTDDPAVAICEMHATEGIASIEPPFVLRSDGTDPYVAEKDIRMRRARFDLGAVVHARK